MYAFVYAFSDCMVSDKEKDLKFPFLLPLSFVQLHASGCVLKVKKILAKSLKLLDGF